MFQGSSRYSYDSNSRAPRRGFAAGIGSSGRGRGQSGHWEDKPDSLPQIQWSQENLIRFEKNFYKYEHVVVWYILNLY